MTDIVERLRPASATFVELQDAVNTMREAADEIERLRDENARPHLNYEAVLLESKGEIDRLRADNERLRAALWDVIDAYEWWCEDQYDRDQRVVGDAIYEARAALKGE